MKNNKKIIGVCVTKVQDDFRMEYLARLHALAAKNDCKIIVFNSPRDFFVNESYDDGARTIFDVINYDLIDALVILKENFHDTQTVAGIIDTACGHGVPVILIHGDDERCICINPDYTEAYKEVLRHVFGVHKIKDPIFMRGTIGEPNSELRLECFKEIIAEFGIEFKEDMVCWGDYWDVPARQTINSIMTARKDTGMPDAVICANDIMAMAVCDELGKKDYRVPEDIIVTGFDGLTLTDFFVPRLTTCREDLDVLAQLTFDAVDKAVNEGLRSAKLNERYEPYISESCGCKDHNPLDYRSMAITLFNLSFDSKQHENHIFKWADSVLESDTISSLSASLRDYVLPNSGVCLNERFIITTLGHITEKGKEHELIVISSKNEDFTGGKQGRFPAADMVSNLDNWVLDDSMAILTPIFVGAEPCGYYAAFTEDVKTTAPKLARVSKIMNIAFGSLLRSITSSRTIQDSKLNAHFNDALTELYNLKGIKKWFDSFSAVPENHKKTVSLSVYIIPQYQFIFENYGEQDIEEAVKFTASALKLANKDNGIVARTGNNEFVVINYVDDPNDIGTVIDNAVSVFYGIIEGYNSGSAKDYFVEVNCGCTVANEGWDSTFESLKKLANSDMYVNKLKAGQSPVLKSDFKTDPAFRSSTEIYKDFRRLVDNNLFSYVFQPIVNAKTAEIYAYEALMRTSGDIKMSPLEILDIAKMNNELYSIEKATMFNVMERYVKETEKFKDRKVFINTIPGNFLKESDLRLLKEKYGKYVDSFVFEITEQDTVSDDELNAIRSLGAVDGSDSSKVCQIAVDDYGTGHSNIVNLLRYAPHVIKIDRFLISEIQNDANKQMFVKSTIEFAKMNKIKVLAEGVETYDELRTVIDYGVDFIQGYYTSRPAGDPVDQIPENIRNEMIAENLILSKYNKDDMLIYEAKNGESINLYDLTISKYGCAHITEGEVRFVGSFNQTFDFEIDVAQGANAKIILDNISIKAVGEPCIQLGKGSDVIIELVGRNSIQKNGILVPPGASLTVVGDGSLNLSVRRNGGVGIGGGYDSDFGRISFELAKEGFISSELQIDNCICIGGRTSTDDSGITVKSGKIGIIAQCVNSIGIGSIDGSCDIDIRNEAELSITSRGKNAVGIGTFNGDVKIASSGKLDVTADGEQCAAIGSIGDTSRTGSDMKTANITLDGGSINAIVHSSNAVCIGSIKGKANVNIEDGKRIAYGEGDAVCGYGSSEGIGKNCISGGSVNVKILSGCVRQFGSDKCSTIITGGNIHAADERNVLAINGSGDELRPVHFDGDSFSKVINSRLGSYEYKAVKLSTDNDICAYLPV